MIETEYRTRLPLVEMPSRKGRLETYLWDAGDETSASIAEDFYNPDRPLNTSGVLIPVAAHQEADRIAHSMSEYAAQEGAKDFSVLLFLNYPFDADQQSVERCIEEVEKAKLTHPDLDIRYSVMSYEKPIIGQVRKDLWDATMRVALADGLYNNFDGEFIGINHDIDTEKIGRHYIRNVQNHYRDLQNTLDFDELSEDVLPPRFTQTKHAFPFDTHPNVARALLWADLTYRQLARNGCYEEGMVIPLSHYAQKGGFNSASATYETSNLAPKQGEGIPLTPMDTSPRRYIARVGEGYSNIWSDETFTSTDDCRDPQKLPDDISKEKLEDTILEDLDDKLVYFCRSVPWERWQKLINQKKLYTRYVVDYESYDLIDADLRAEVAEILRPRFKLARRVLETMIDSPTLADLIDDSVVDRFAHDVTKELQKHVRGH